MTGSPFYSVHYASMLTRAEVSQHSSKERCLVIIKGMIYDLSSYMHSHPGGSHIIRRYAGRDATKAFEPIHPNGVIEKNLPPEMNLGAVAETDMGTTPVCLPNEIHSSETSLVNSSTSLLRSVVNLNDFETAASQILPARSFAFFKSGAEDEETVAWNCDSWYNIRFCPRVLRPIRSIDLTTSILGTTYSAPFFICPAGGSKLAHPSGDLTLTQAAGKNGILHWVPNNTGCGPKQLADARTETQTLYWQIYAMEDLSVTEKEVKDAIDLGYRAFALTVDAIHVGKRERDLRLIIKEEEDLGANQEDDDNGFSGGPTVPRSQVYTDFDWTSAVSWMRKITDLPIAIKGIQSWEDAALCMKHGVHPWLSNHGGRQLEGAPSALDTLLEIRRNCPDVIRHCDVIVDGGIRRGTDIVKALALGARGVGLGRSFLYALAFGKPGVNKAIKILENEVITTMALLGVGSIDQLSPDYVNVDTLNFRNKRPRYSSRL